MIRRPKATDFGRAGFLGTLGACLDGISRGTTDARKGSTRLTRALALIVLLPAMLLPILAWFQSELPGLFALFAVYGVVAIFCFTFWACCGKGPLSERLGSKRERLGSLEDAAEMRAKLLSAEKSGDLDR